MKKLFLRAEFGPLWEPWEVDEIGRKTIIIDLTEKNMLNSSHVFVGEKLAQPLSIIFHTETKRFL